MRRLVPVALLALFVLAASAWTWPVRGPVLESFSFDRAHPYGAGQHRGIAIGADAGASVLAPAAGVVRFAGTVPTNGKTITIETPAAPPPAPAAAPATQPAAPAPAPAPAPGPAPAAAPAPAAPAAPAAP